MWLLRLLPVRLALLDALAARPPCSSECAPAHSLKQRSMRTWARARSSCFNVRTCTHLHELSGVCAILSLHFGSFFCSSLHAKELPSLFLFSNNLIQPLLLKLLQNSQACFHICFCHVTFNYFLFIYGLGIFKYCSPTGDISGIGEKEL